MAFDKNSASILILIALPFQFNLLTDSYDLILTDMRNEWKTKRELTYYEYYFGKKLTFYVGMVTSIIFIFIFYRYGKARLIISIIFILNGFTWLVYYAVNEERIYIIHIVRSLQGVYLGVFQMISFPYIIKFSKTSRECFSGCLIQFSMFLGLFIMNLFFNFLSWRTVTIIFFVLSIIFSLLIWLVPEFYIKPKSLTKEYVTNKTNIGNIIIMLLIMLLQQFSGISSLLGQLSNMLQGIGVNIGVNLQSCLFDFVGALSTIICAFIVDSVSTKFMWFFSSLGLIIGLVIYGLTLRINIGNWVGTLGVFFYFLFYGLGEGPIPWILCCTMFNEGVRIECSAINLWWNLFLPPVLDLFWDWLNSYGGQFGSTLFHIVSCFIAIFFGLYFIPFEKKYSTLTNINIM